jgi:DNA-binding transcriptional MerR regulator
MWKAAGAFRSIGEVADLIGVAPHVLRYWETQFTQLKPMKRPDGRRYYRPDDVRLAAGLCEVLREEGLTIRGAKKLMAKDRGEAIRQRGAARLGEAMGSALSDPSESVMTSPSRQRIGQQAQFTDPPEDEPAEDQPDHAPRARHRRRPHGHVATATAAPIAQSATDAVSPPHSENPLLPRLVMLAAQLRALPGLGNDRARFRDADRALRHRVRDASENSSA